MIDTAAPLNIALVAGEPSGDALGARLIQALHTRYPNARFFGIGGPKMINAGFQSWYPMETLSVNGIFEALRHYPAIARMRNQLIQRLLADKPDLFIGIDAPDFNLDLECRLKAQGIPTIHYISPTIWAWRSNRIHTIKKACEHMLVLFPFEAPLYAQHNLPATYVGHPLADDIPLTPPTQDSRITLQCTDKSPIFTLLPGSRNSEVRFHGDLMVQTAQRLFERYPNACFPVPTATENTRRLFEEAITRNQADNVPFLILDKQSDTALSAADVVIVASGTATLETALWKKPMVITYRLSWLTWQILKRLVRAKYVGLPNILSDEAVVPEYLQDQATPENLVNAAADWIEHPEKAKRVIEQFDRLHHQLRQSSSETAAEAVSQFLSAQVKPS